MNHLFSLLKSAVIIGLFALTANSTFATCTYQTELTGVMNHDGVALTWETKTENNNQYFVIERSKNGIDFEMVGKVKAAGTSQATKKYKFSDFGKTQMYARYFYRLVQLDFDETASFSHVTVVTKNDKSKLFDLTSLQSSAVDEVFEFHVNATTTSDLTYNIQTQMGEILLKGKKQMKIGDNVVSVRMKDLNVGRYQFAMKVENEISVIQVKKVNSAELPALNFAQKNSKTKN